MSGERSSDQRLQRIAQRLLGLERQALPPAAARLVKELLRDAGAAVKPADQRGASTGLMTEKLRELLTGAEGGYGWLFERNLDAVFATDTEGRYVAVNPTAEEMTGYSAAELRQMSFVQLSAPDCLEEVQRRFQFTMQGHPQNLEMAIIAKDGRRVELFVTGVPLVGEGQNLGVLGIARDITSAHRAKRDLEARERAFRTLAENAPEVVWRMDAELRYLYVNPALERNTGHSLGEHLGKTRLQMGMPEALWRPMDAACRAAFATGQPQEGETAFALPGWSGRRHYLVRIVPEPGPGGKVDSVLGISTDITELRQAEEALRRLNRKLRAMRECTQVLVRSNDEPSLLHEVCRIIVEVGGYRLAWVGFAAHDADKTVSPVAFAGHNAGYLKKAHITWADVARGRGPVGTAIRTGKAQTVRDTFSDPLFAPWREEAVERGFAAVIALPLQSAEAVFGALNLYSATPGDFAPDEVELLTDLAGDLAYGIMALRTRTERDRTAAELDQHRKHLEELVEQRTLELTRTNTRLRQELTERTKAEQQVRQHEQQLRSLASELTLAEHRERQNLAHVLHDDLQQWLAAGKARLDVLKMKQPDAATRAALDEVAQTLVRADLACRGLTAELCPPVLQQFGLADALAWLAEQMHERHGLAVQVEADERARPATYEFGVLLYQSVRELLFNTVKHAKVKAARVRLAPRGGDRLQIIVADSGAGFDPAGLQKDGAGAGFGLFSVRERLELMGGAFEINSAPGRGTRITLTAPMQALR